MGKAGRVGFPVLPIKRNHGHIQVHPVIQRPPGNRKAIRIGARDVETFDAAGLAEQVFRFAGIEGVLAEIVLTLKKPEPA